MPQYINTLISTSLRRVRDPNAIGTSRALVMSFMSRLQQVLNAKTRSAKHNYVLTTKARQLVYPVFANLPNVVHIERIRDGDGNPQLYSTKYAELSFEPNWRNLSNYRKTWFRDVEDQHETFSLMGRDLLILHPAKNQDSAVSVVATKLTAPFTQEPNTLTEINDSELPILLDLTEMMLSIKSRRLQNVSKLTRHISQNLGIVLVKKTMTEGKGGEVRQTERAIEDLQISVGLDPTQQQQQTTKANG